jgi:hypothetical protein
VPKSLPIAALAAFCFTVGPVLCALIASVDCVIFGFAGYPPYGAPPFPGAMPPGMMPR